MLSTIASAILGVAALLSAGPVSLVAGPAYGASIFIVQQGGTGAGTHTPGNLLVGAGTAPIQSVATTTANCTGSATCDPFVVIGNSPVTINASGGSSSTFGTTSISAAAPLSWDTNTAQMSITQAGAASNGYLSSTDWNVFNNKISSTSLSGTAPITYNSSTGAIGCNVASGSQAGCLSSANWTLFNDKISSSSLSGASVISYTAGTGVITTTGGTFGSGDYIFPAKVTAVNASTTLFSTSYASSTQYHGAGLTACAGATNALTWTGGVFGCNTISGGSSFAYPFPNNATSTLLDFNGGLTFSNATGTNLFAGRVTGNTAAFGQTGSTTISSTGALVTPSATIGSGSGLAILTSGAVSTIAGTTCTSQFLRAFTSAGGTCATVANTDLANSTISGIALGSNLADLTFGSTLTSTGNYNGGTARTLNINLNNANTWTALQQFSAGLTSYASTTIGGGNGTNGLTVSGNSTTTGNQVTQGTGTSTFAGGVSVAKTIDVQSTTATSTFANGIQLTGGCFYVAGACLGGSSGGSGVASTTIKRYTANDTWTKPAKLLWVVVEVQGPGGNGGNSSPSGIAGGGGGGGYGRSTIPAAALAGTETVTVGAANSGTASSFGSWCSGGAGGTGASGLTGASGGTASGCLDVNINGQQGGDAGSPSGALWGGSGGDSVMGTGGPQLTCSGNTSSRNGYAGQGYGGGGSGATAACDSSPNAGTGGTATAGIVIVYEYLSP